VEQNMEAVELSFNKINYKQKHQFFLLEFNQKKNKIIVSTRN